MNNILNALEKRRTFAIISHPDAGKTTLTEKILLLGGAINLAGSVKARKASRHATSDWMELEKKRGISVTTSVMQFEYAKHIFNLLDTPGHADFSEDTYRTLTAVDSALMVIDVAKGVEARTIKLMEVCRMRTTPIITFINKCDRFGKDPITLLDEVESVLNIYCAPITWPIGLGTDFKGVYHLIEKSLYLYDAKKTAKINTAIQIDDLDSPQVKELLDEAQLENLKSEIELIEGAAHEFDHAKYLKGELTPVFFGSALINFGVDMLLQSVANWAPIPLKRKTKTRYVEPQEKKFSAFAFKVQANMDPKHRDRIAFVRITSGKYEKGKKLYQVRTQKQLNTPDALTFMAGNRTHTAEAYAGDIIGLHNHGTIQIGDTFTEGEDLQFIGIPHFAPELFKSVRPRDPLKMKALLKGLVQLSEEGATQIFRPLASNQIILGAVGVLQFDVVQHRLHNEYNADCIYENITVATARWISCNDLKKLAEFKIKTKAQLALDGKGELCYIAPSKVNLQLTQERWPAITFAETCEVV